MCCRLRRCRCAAPPPHTLALLVRCSFNHRWFDHRRPASSARSSERRSGSAAFPPLPRARLFSLLQNSTLLKCDSGVVLGCGAKGELPGADLTFKRVFGDFLGDKATLAVQRSDDVRSTKAPASAEFGKLDRFNKDYERLCFVGSMRKQHVYELERIELLSQRHMSLADNTCTLCVECATSVLRHPSAASPRRASRVALTSSHRVRPTPFVLFSQPLRGVC